MRTKSSIEDIYARTEKASGKKVWAENILLMFSLNSTIKFNIKIILKIKEFVDENVSAMYLNYYHRQIIQMSIKVHQIPVEVKCKKRHNNSTRILDL